MSSTEQKCFHCNEDIPNHINISTFIDDSKQAYCCFGCKAVAEFINEQNCNEFFSYRGQAKPASKVNIEESKWLQYDEEINFNNLTKKLNDGLYRIAIRVDGLYCSACGWLIDKQISSLQGVKQVQLNSITKQVQVSFKLEDIKLSSILLTINKLGYKPILTVAEDPLEHSERKTFLRQIVVAGFGMMQVMTMSVPLYSESYTIDPNIKRFFELVSLLVATLVYFYSGKVFIKNALRDLRNRHLGMDVPVALSISLAYIASCWIVFTGSQSTIYFDSMIMFIFFLLAGRYVEMSVRHKGMNAQEALSAMIPSSVKKMKAGQASLVPLSEIAKGDHLFISQGEIIACDGKVIHGECEIDESLLTGESKSVSKSIGDSVLAGTKVQRGTIQIESMAIGKETLLEGLSELLSQAQMQKPKTLLMVDKIAVWFVACVLLMAALTAVYYSFNQAHLALPIALSVLVATCPCALSLATPTALTAATVHLMNKGVLIKNLDSLTKLFKVNNWYFDKTGTLTEPNMSVVKIHNFSSIKVEELLSIMACLEHNSSHPIASAFSDYYNPHKEVAEYKEISGHSVQAQIDGTLYKSGAFEACPNGFSKKLNVTENTVVYLSDNQDVLVAFELKNKLRDKAHDIIDFLQQQRKSITILSGDNKQSVSSIAQQLDISEFHSQQSPEQKIQRINDSQNNNQPTVMIGDGVNDAPVLAQSDVSISFSQGTHIARSASDIVIMGASLKSIRQLFILSKKTNSIINQNIIWALFYNVSVAPLAMMGYLTPWMAALGMSMSSLIVVINARRIMK